MNNPAVGPKQERRGRQPTIKVQAFLANLPMFSEMSPTELDRVAGGTQVHHVAKGETVFRTGDACVGFHVVVYGQVKLGFTSPQGVEKLPWKLYATETGWFGWTTVTSAGVAVWTAGQY